MENEEFSIENKIRIGQSKEEVIKLCKELNYSEPLLEDLSEEDLPDQELLSMEKENISFWFTNDCLDEIQLGTYWIDDSTPIWPN